MFFDFRALIVGGVKLVQYIVQVHFHVAFLDSGCGERTQSRKILCESRNGNNLHQFSSRWISEHFKRELNQWVKGCESAYCSQCQRNLHPKMENTVFDLRM